MLVEKARVQQMLTTEHGLTKLAMRESGPRTGLLYKKMAGTARVGRALEDRLASKLLCG